MRLIKTGIHSLCVVMALALTGCFITEEPLLDASNGRSKPIPEGAYKSCPYSEGESDGDCTAMSVTIDDTRQYRLAPEGEEPSLVRFRRIGRGARLAQFQGDNEEGYFYFLARKEGTVLSLTMLVCDDLPETVLNSLKERGDLETEEGGAICVPKNLGAAVEAARAYRDDGTIPRSMELRISPAEGDG